MKFHAASFCPIPHEELPGSEGRDIGEPQFRFWRLDVIKPARWHPELDRGACRRLRRETGGSDSRSPEARHLCDDLAGRRPHRPDAGHRPIRWRFGTARKADQPPCDPSHRMESATPHSNETFRSLRPRFRVVDIEMPPLCFFLSFLGPPLPLALILSLLL